MEMTKTALVTFASSRDRIMMGRNFAADSDYVVLLNETLSNRTDRNVHTPDKLHVGRSFIDEASAQLWLDFVLASAPKYGVTVESTEIVPYIGPVHLEFLPI